MICLRQVFFLLTLSVSIDALDKCPENIQTVDTLDVQKYFGYWYDTYGTDSRITTEGNRCIRANYKSFSRYLSTSKVNKQKYIFDFLDETFISVRNVAIKVGNTDFTEICGYGYQIHPDTDPGKLEVGFPSGSTPGIYCILGTDYDNYACTYSCSEFNGSANVFASVLTRDPFPTFETVEKCLDIFIANGVDIADFVTFSQEDCYYGFIDSISCDEQ